MRSPVSPFHGKLASILRPLTRAEATKAERTAIRYLEPQLVRDGAARYRVLGSELHISRPMAASALPTRQVEVLVVDYLNRRHLRIVLEAEKVIQVRDLEHQPAVSSDEVAEAVELAAAVPELSKLAKRKSVFVSHFAPGRREPGERCIGLYYLAPGRDGRAGILAEAEVDLVEQRVVAVRLPGEGSKVLGE